MCLDFLAREEGVDLLNFDVDDIDDNEKENCDQNVAGKS